MGDGPGDGLWSLARTYDQKRQLRVRIALGLWLRGRPGRLAVSLSLFESLTGAGERIALSVDQVLNFQSQLYVAAAIKPLAGSALIGFELRKLRLPKAQDISFDAADASDIANLEVEAVGDRGQAGVDLRG